MRMSRAALVLLPCLSLSIASAVASDGPVAYEIDPAHTFPSIEADHMGLSVWRGKFERTTGTVMLDKAGETGSVALEIDMSSVDFGYDPLNDLMAGEEYFDTAAHPVATYEGALVDFVDGAPTRVDGMLTLRGVTRPVDLEIRSFKCMAHPLVQRDWCGGDAYATIDRTAFGIVAGREWGFDMDVDLRIQVEAVQGGVPPLPDAATAAVPDAALVRRTGADEHGMRRYVLVILKTGPTPVTDPEARKAMFAGHFANMERLSDEGTLALAGPFMQDPAGWRGLFVLAVEDVEDAKRLVATDPVVASGEMVAEYHPWYASAATMMIPELHERLQPPTP